MLDNSSAHPAGRAQRHRSDVATMAPLSATSAMWRTLTPREPLPGIGTMMSAPLQSFASALNPQCVCECCK